MEEKEEGVEQEGMINETQEESQPEFAPIPEGLDEEIFDTETRTLKEDKVVERLKELNDKVASANKQRDDMRRKLSKGVTPLDSIEAYGEGYTNDRYDFILTDEESEVGKGAKDILKIFDEYSYNHGLSKEASKDLKNLVLAGLEDLGHLDARSEEEKETDHKNFIAEQKKLLGDDAEKIIADNVKFFKSYGFFSEDEKKALLSAMNTDARWNSIGRKIRVLFGQASSEDIPTHGVSDGLADDHTLSVEYNDPKTSDARRFQILQQRIDAGRGGLPSDW